MCTNSNTALKCVKAIFYQKLVSISGSMIACVDWSILCLVGNGQGQSVIMYIIQIQCLF